MEDLQSLMTCLDDISSKIPDGVYLEMADKLKRVHAQMNGNKPIDEDTFYSDTESDTESDSEYEPLTEDELRLGREREVQKIKDEILECVKEMHEEYKVLKRWEKEARRTWTPIKRMTAFRKSQAIKQWCEKNVSLAPGGQAGELVGCISTAAASKYAPTCWTWENLMENGLRAVVMEIGTEEEIIRAQRGFVYYEDLSLKTIQKFPAFEKKIYDDYKEECQRKMTEYFENAKLKVVESKAKMTGLETACVEREYLLGVGRGSRPFWNSATNDFCANGGHP
jgi:hypothetical protein